MRQIVFATLAFFPASSVMAAEVTHDVKDGVVTFIRDKVVLTAYKFEGNVAVEKGEGTQPLAKPFFYPISTPDGTPVTRDWPMQRGNPGETVDHFHQKSGWFCHGDVIPEGIKLKSKSAERHVQGVDFWSEAKGHGRITSFIIGKNDQRPEDFLHGSHWLSPDDDLLLDEFRTITVSIVEGGTLIVVNSKMSAKLPITFGDTKEGSFGIRVHDELRLSAPNSKSVVTSSDGSSVTGPKKGLLPIWGQVAAWHDYSGAVNGKPVGVAIFTDPKNKYASCWHTRDYGLLAANPFGRDKSGFPGVKGKTDLIKLKPGESLELRFAVFAHTGDVKAGKVAEAYEFFKGK